MFVAVALTLFDLDAGLDAPAPACAEIAAIMNIMLAQALTGQPHMPGLFVDQLAAVGIDLLPGAA